ncbi:MAG: hypothetical protein Q7R39_04275 [Dehalococcoidia bacterium]|nr:hypothetical protein [Dehalococcoidia bacterium]
MGTTASAKLPSAPGQNRTCLTRCTTSLDEPEALAFDPVQHLRTLEDGSEYLDARWRLVWFLENHSEYSITSNLVHLSPKLVIVKVTITLPGGRSAEGLGMASAHDVYRYVETAQTHALARALAMLGFGTESALDFDTDAPADAGVQRNGNNGKKEPVSQALPTDGSKETSQQIPPARQTQEPQEGPPQPPPPADSLPSWASLGDTKAEDASAGIAKPAPNGNHEASQTSGREAGLQCQECHGPVKEGRTRQGKVLSPQEVAERARQETGKVLCPRCLTQHIARGSKGGRSQA